MSEKVTTLIMFLDFEIVHNLLIVEKLVNKYLLIGIIQVYHYFNTI